MVDLKNRDPLTLPVMLCAMAKKAVAMHARVSVHFNGCSMHTTTLGAPPLHLLWLWYKTGRGGPPILEIGADPTTGICTYQTFMAYPVDGNTPLRHGGDRQETHNDSDVLGITGNQQNDESSFGCE